MASQHTRLFFLNANQTIRSKSVMLYMQVKSSSTHMVRFSRAQSINTRFITWPESILYLYVTRLTFYYEILDPTTGGANTLFSSLCFFVIKTVKFHCQVSWKKSICDYLQAYLKHSLNWDFRLSILIYCESLRKHMLHYNKI